MCVSNERERERERQSELEIAVQCRLAREEAKTRRQAQGRMARHAMHDGMVWYGMLRYGPKCYGMSCFPICMVQS